MFSDLANLTLAELIGYLSMTILASTGLLILIHIYRRSSITDRIIAVDIFATVGVSLIAVYAIITGQDLVLDVALILALLAFLSTAAFAYYISKRET